MVSKEAFREDRPTKSADHQDADEERGGGRGGPSGVTSQVAGSKVQHRESSVATDSADEADDGGDEQREAKDRAECDQSASTCCDEDIGCLNAEGDHGRTDGGNDDSGDGDPYPSASGLLGACDLSGERHER